MDFVRVRKFTTHIMYMGIISRIFATKTNKIIIKKIPENVYY